MTINVGWLTFNRQTNSENYHVNMLMKLCNRGFSWFSNRRANEPKVGSGSQFFHPTWGEDCQNHYVIMMGPSYPMWVHPQVTIALCQQRSPLAQVPSFQLPQLPPVGGPTKFHPISIREGQKKHVRTCIHTYIVRVYYIYIFIHKDTYVSFTHIYIYICRHTIVTINQDLSLQAALPSLQQRLWCSPWVSGKNPKIWPTDSRFQGVSRNGPREFWIPFMSGKHGKTCGKTWLMPIDANWCYVFLIFL